MPELAGYFLVERSYAGPDVDKKNNNLSLVDGCLYLFVYSLGYGGQWPCLQAAGIDKSEFGVLPGNSGEYSITGGARQVFYDSYSPACQPIQ